MQLMMMEHQFQWLWTLSFKEIEPVYDVDYGDENNRSRILKWDTSENYQN